MNSWIEVAVPRLELESEFPTLSLSDTASGEKKRVPKKSIYRMYVCGITPYDATHLGHAATYLTFDLINRFLRASGSQVKYVQNITDIDDPLLERANRDGVDWQDLAHEQIELFRSDMTHLRVIPPESYIGAVDAIPLVIDAITSLDKKDSIYSVESDLYFKVGSDADFGSRSHLSHEKMLEIFSQRGGDPSRAGKSDPLDCLVWMSQRPNEPGWDSPFGEGRPGWHIECTAIALAYLEPSNLDKTLIDIQGGGSDLIFPHHEMCAAQAHVLTGKELAENYVHAGMIGLDGEKMSKSKGNLVFVSKLLSAGVEPIAIRWALMLEHYKSDRMWTDELLSLAQEQIKNFKEALISQSVADTQTLIPKLVLALADDLNTPLFLQLLNEWSEETLKGASGGDSEILLQSLDSLVGFTV